MILKLNRDRNSDYLAWRRFNNLVNMKYSRFLWLHNTLMGCVEDSSSSRYSSKQRMIAMSSLS